MSRDYSKSLTDSAIYGSEIARLFEERLNQQRSEELRRATADLKEVSKQLTDISSASKPAAEGISQVSDAVKKLNSSDDKDPDSEEFTHDTSSESLVVEEKEFEEFLELLFEVLDVVIDSGDKTLAYKLEKYIERLKDEHKEG